MASKHMTEADAAKVETLVVDYYNGLSDADVKKCCACFCDDGVMYGHMLPTVKGTAELHKTFAEVFDAFELCVKPEILSLNVKGDLAVVATSTHGTVNKKKESLLRTQQTRGLFHLVKVDGDWKISHYM